MNRAALGPGAEFDLIRRILATDAAAGRTADARARLLVGPGDDCAVVAGPAGNLAITIDSSIEGVHFRREWLSPESMGYRATAAALSDLAAMAASPIGVLGTVAVPPADGAHFARAIMAGVSAAAREHDAMLLGGDLSDSPGAVFIDIAALGDVRDPVRRSGAEPGDHVWVTGELGNAAAAVRAWNAGREPAPAARAAFERPVPRLTAARWLKERGIVKAMIDISDGLAGDARHLAAAGGVCIALEEPAIPVGQAVRDVTGDERAALELAVAGGEDYELCFVAAAGAMEAVVEEFTRELGIRVTRVGVARGGEGVVRIDAGGVEHPLDLSGYSHFRKQPETA